MFTKDKTNVPILAITPENYAVPKGEEHLYHVKLEVKSFDQHTGKRLSHPFIQKFSRIDFENGTMSILRQQGYDITVLHNPKDWLSERSAALVKAKELKEAEAKKKAEEAAAEAKKKAEEEMEALKAQIRAELLAEMKAKAEAETKKAKKTSKKSETPAEPETPTEPAAGTDEEPDLS